MAKFETEEMQHLAVALLVAMESIPRSDNHLSCTLLELQSAFNEEFSGAIELNVVRAVLDSASTFDTEYFEIVESRFADTRYIFDTRRIRVIARNNFEAEDVYQQYDTAGYSWLRECVTNILGAHGLGTVANEDAIPAADRYVTKDDNQASFSEISANLDTAAEELRGSNEITEEDRFIALSEIAIFEATIAQPRVAVDLIERFLAFCQTKLMKLVSAAMAALLIDKLKGLLAQFMSTIS